MSAQNFETFLARIYVDAALRSRFRANPLSESRKAGLSEEESKTLENMDWAGLELASRSFARKRALQGKSGGIFSGLGNFFAIFSSRFRRR